MVRETRHLWVGNLPDSIREDRIRDHFKRYGRVQSVKLLGRKEDEGGGLCATVSFMDIKSAAKAHHSEQKLEDRLLTTEYHEPPSIPSTNSIHYSSRYPSSEEVVGFERSHFYEGGGREGRDYLSRRYHAEPIPPRSRRQDARIYRNGPYTTLISPTTERSRTDHHGRSWGYESPRYTTSSVPTPQEIYPEERRESSCLHSSKKHSKSRSGSDSASTASSRSRSSSPSSRSSSCSSATSSPASDKSCSTHSQHGSLRGNAGSVNASSINSSSPAIHNEDRRPLAICVRNLPARSSDTSLKDGLYHEYKKHGKVTWVKVVGQGSERYAVVCFKKTEDVDKALQVSHDKLFFGCKIDVAPYQGYDVDDNEFSFVCRPFEADQDEFHPKATRTLFIGNLEKDITSQEIRKHFDQFGEILDIDIKKQGTTSSSYAFCQYTDIASVVRAIRSLDGEHLGSTRVKLGFGKSLHTNCVWVDGISESVSEKCLSQHFSQFGPVSHVHIDRTRGQALISFEQITYAQQAVKEMRGVMLRGRKLQIDYASRECQDAFYDHMDKQSNQHSNYDTSVSGGVASGNVRGFETPSSSSSSSGGGSASGRYAPSSRTYPQAGQTSRYHSSPSQQRSSRQRYSEYPSDYPQDRRTSYRSYEDVISVEDGEGRHKERVEIEECQSSGEEGTGRRKCKHRRSEGDTSRPGTPLCDERPEPTEPRRPRERTQDPLSLPLPRFATQVLPPPSPPSSDDSQPSPPSPEWEERLRSLDEKYRKWSGSRTNPTKPDPTSVRLRHRLLALDPHDLQPSDIVKSVLAKRSVFDEDLKRLENFGEKYEPKEFVPNRVVRSPGSPVQGKGLQYPFPSHPDPSRPPTSGVSAPAAANTSPASTGNPPSFTKPQSQPSQVPAPIVKPKAEKTEIKKDITSSLLVSSIKPKPFRRDSEPSEARRKSREEAPEITKSLESAVKKEDTSDSDKVKDAQVCERRKSTAEKRRSSIDIKESNIVEVLDKTKDNLDKKEARRASCDSLEPDMKIKDPRKHLHESIDVTSNPEADKHKKLDSEYRKDTELGPKNPGNIDIDRKKDIFGVNSEKDRRRKDIFEVSSDNLKHKKVPETNKCDSLVVKPDNDEIKTPEADKRKEEAAGVKSKDNKKEPTSTDRERRRDSMDSDIKRPPKLDEYPKHKENKMFNEIKTPKKELETEFSGPITKKDAEKDVNKSKEVEKKRNCENEISKETSLFKKVFGFTDSLRNKDNNKKTEISTPKVETPDKIKEKKEILNETKNKEAESMRHKPVSRKSPDNHELLKHRDTLDKKKTSESESVDRKKKEHDISSDDFLPKDYHINYLNKRKVIERCLTKEGININTENDHINKFSKDHDKKKDYFYDECKRNEEFDALLESTKQKENENKHDNFTKDYKKKEFSHSDSIRTEKKLNSDNNFDSDKFFDSEKKMELAEKIKENKNDTVMETLKFKHEKHQDRKKHQEFVDNIKFKDDKKKDDTYERHRKKESDFENIRQKEESAKNNDRKKDHFDNNKFRDMDDAIRKRKDLESLEQTKPKESSERKKDLLEKERRRDRELVDAKFKDNEEKRKDAEKEKKRKEIESHEKLNGDHIECLFDSVEDHDQKDSSNKKDKKKEHRLNSWPASIGCKRRLSSQDSDLIDENKRSKQERRDSKDSGKSSSSSKKGEKHGKGFSKSIDERIKEEKEHEKKKDEMDMISEEKHKKQLKKEKKNEKKKEDKKFKSRQKENGTASESDLNSGDDEVKNLKRQHSIFDIVDDEPAYISMYDKVKARSTKNMQKQEEEKRQEKLKEKFSQLKQSRAKREEKKRSTSYDEDSDSERGGAGGGHNRRSNKLMITSSEEDAGSECDIKLSAKNKKLTFDFSEDDSMLVTPKSKLIRSHNQDHEAKARKILSDTSEDDVLRHSTPKLKPKVNLELEAKSRKIMSDTSEDDNLKSLSRIKPSRIQSDESENELASYNINKEDHSNQLHTNSVPEDLFTHKEFTNHNSVKASELSTNLRSSSPEDFRRNSLEVSEMPRKKKKQKKQKNFDDGDGSYSKKHSSKKDKKKSHNKDDDENCKKSKKKKDRDNSKREEKIEDIFGPLSDDSDKALMWHVNQVLRSDSDSEHEAIRKKEKRRREKKSRELDEAGRALEANLMMDPNETYQVVEPVKNKKKKRKKSRDEKMKHHHSEVPLDQRGDEQRQAFMHFIDYSKSHQKIRQNINILKLSEKEEDDFGTEEFSKENRFNDDSQHRMEEEAVESILPQNSDSDDVSNKTRPKSMASLLDSPPPLQSQHSHQTKKIDIPGFRGLDVDEDIHETAVKSISESSSNSIQINEPKFEPEKAEPASNDDKPTTVISQEETEDAVAALLMEDTFNGNSGEFDGYTEDTPKPDTPASEPDLQIDTDAEETYDIDISKPPRTPDLPQSFYRQVDTREGLEERILPLVCSSDTPSKEEIKVLEVPRTPGSGLERKSEEDQPSEIQPIRLNLDISEKSDADELDVSDSLGSVTQDEPKNKLFELKTKNIDSVGLKEKPVSHETPEPIKKTSEQERNDAIFDSLVRGTIINDSMKKDIIKPSDNTSSCSKSFISNIVSTPQPDQKTVEPIIIKQNPPSVLSHISKEVEKTDVAETAPLIPALINKPISTVPTSHVSAFKSGNAPISEGKSDVDHLRVSVSQTCIQSPTTVVHQTGPSIPCLVRPQLHLPSTLNPVATPISVVRTSSIQSHPISTQTRATAAQVHHLTVIPSQPVRSPGSPHMLQHGLAPKPVTQVLQQPSTNPVIRHAVSSNIQQVKPSATAIVVSQPNMPRQLHIVAQPAHIPSQNLKLIRAEQPNSSINIVRLVRPVAPTQCLPAKQNVPLLQPLSTSEIRPLPPLHEIKEPPTLVAIQDKPVIQHTHLSTPVNVIRNPSTDVPESNKKVLGLIEESEEKIESREPPALKELSPPKLISLDFSKDTEQTSDSKGAFCSDDNSTSNDQNYELDDTKPLNAVINDLTSKLFSKQGSEEETVDETDKSEDHQTVKTDVKPPSPISKSDDTISSPLPVDLDTPKNIKVEPVEFKEETNDNNIDDNKVVEFKKIEEEDTTAKSIETETNIKVEIKEEILEEEKDDKLDKSRKEDFTAEEKESDNVKNPPEDLVDIKPVKKEELVLPVMEASTPVEKTVISRETRGRKRKRKVKQVPPRKTKNNPTTPAKTNADIYEFRDDSEEERPRLILTIKSPPDRTEPIKIKSTPSTRKSRRLQEKDGVGGKPVEEIPEGVVVRSTGRPGRRATRSTQPNLTVTLNPEPRKSPRRKHTQPPSIVEEKPIKVESPPTPPPTPAAPNATVVPSVPVLQNTPVAPIPAVLPNTTVALNTPVVPNAVTVSNTPVTPVVVPVSRPSTPVNMPAVPPTPPSSATPPATATPVVTNPSSVPSAPVVTTPPPTVTTPMTSTSTTTIISSTISTVQSSVVTVVTSSPTVPTPSPSLVSVPPASTTSALPLVSPPVKFLTKPVMTPTALQVQTQGSIPINVSISSSGNSLQNRNSLEPTTLIDPVTGLLIPMQESEEGQYIPLHSDLNRTEGEPSKKRLRVNVEVSRPSVVRQVLPPTSTSQNTHSSAVSLAPVHQVVQSQVPHHPALHIQAGQHQTSQALAHPPHSVQSHQPPVSQHQVQQLSLPPPHLQPHPVAQVCQPGKPATGGQNSKGLQLQSLATVTPVHVSHPPPPLMPVSSSHHPPGGVHLQPSLQIQSIPKSTTVSKSVPNIPLATVTVSTPKIVVTKTEPSVVKGIYSGHSIDSSTSMAITSVVHSVAATGSAHISAIPSIVHTNSGGHPVSVHGSVLQSGVSIVNQRSIGVHPAPAHSPALNPAPAHSPALHPAPTHSLVVRSLPHGLNPPAAHMQHAHAIHTPSHADSLRAVPSPAPGAPPGLPVACKPAPITPKAHHLQAVRPRASPSPAHPPPPKAHVHPPITNIRDGSLACTAGPLGPSISSPPPRAAHQQPHLVNPPQSSPRGDVVQHFVNAHMQPAHYVHNQLVYQQWIGSNTGAGSRGSGSKDGSNSPPLELRRPTPPRPPFYDTPPPAHSRPSQPRLHTPPHASQVPPQADSLLMLLQRHPVMWQGLLALKNDQAAVQMHFVFGNMFVARDSLPCNRDGSTPPLRIAQRMRLEQAQIEGVSRKMQSDNEHCMLLALPCGRDHMDVLQQSNNLQSCFITYLQQKQAAGIVNIAVSGSTQPAYVIHIFPSCEFANESLARIAPDLMHRVADIAHLLIVIATV